MVERYLDRGSRSEQAMKLRQRAGQNYCDDEAFRTPTSRAAIRLRRGQVHKIDDRQDRD
jgi:hypothetical protein